MDAFYGQQPKLLNSLEVEKMCFVADINCNANVYLTPPAVRGKLPKNIKKNPRLEQVLKTKPVEVRNIAKSNLLEWNVFKIRDIQRGELWIKFGCSESLSDS